MVRSLTLRLSNHNRVCKSYFPSSYEASRILALRSKPVRLMVLFNRVSATGAANAPFYPDAPGRGAIKRSFGAMRISLLR